jgi:hypothetical protein
MAAFNLLPALIAGTAIVVNPGGTALGNTFGTLALAGNFATVGANALTLTTTADTNVTLPTTGTLATLAGVETLSNKTLVAPALGTPASGVLTNCTGTAAGLTAGNVITNANLTGVIASVGNATSIASQTGTGTKFVVDTSPTLVTPTLGVATVTSINGNTVPAASDTVALLAASQTLSNKVLASTVTATTQSTGDNSTKVATTAYLDSKLGQNNGIATLDSSGKLTAAQIPSSLVGAVNYQGVWNANTNSPTLTSSSGTKGFYYVVSVAGTTTLDGISQWNIGDTAIYNGTVWNKIDGISNEVISVAGKTGVVTLAASDLTNGVQGNGAVVLATSPTITTPTVSGALTYGGVTLAASVTGTGKMVLDTSPTLVTPTLGAATATTINGNALTAGSWTLTGGASKTLTFSNTLTLAGTDGSTVAFGTGGTVLYSGGPLGTPSSGTLTNCTGLPAASLVVGALANGMTATTQSIGDNSTKIASTAFVKTKAESVVGGAILRSYLAGLGTSNNGVTPNTKIDVAAGVCADDTNAQILALSATTLDCGTTGANGLDAGTLANSTWYHLFAIGKTDGTTALLASTSLSSPTFPVGYTLKRRIASFMTDVSAHVLGYVQFGDEFLWLAPPTDVNAALGTTSTPYALTVPLGLNVDAVFTSTIIANDGSALFQSPLQNTLSVGTQGAGSDLVSVQGTIGNAAGGRFNIRTDTNRQIRAVASVNSITLQIMTHGWIDRRGRDA